ncbi:VOC family protein [Rossellomorea aquimaris]|uniref:VOC family protein n=1 Tax=Rossellomorea aquimaris TaxID=189382 RepID=UPI001CD7DD27|nr:VOC family protein [Rossellomorea aquimaris]MCA1055468.1 VOC family protein [Rossellomorea aquimaris]
MNFHQPPHAHVDHVTIKVGNLERSLDFYQRVIGFTVLERSERKARLTADGHRTLVTIEQPEDVSSKQPRTTGLYHFALLLPERADLGRILNHFVRLNIPLGSSDHLVSEALYLNDPDANGIEIYWDKPASTWTWQDGQVKMAVDPIDAKAILAEGQGESWNGLPPQTKMGHIHLHAAELAETADFYTVGLGFEVVSRFGNQALFISTGGYHHHIGLNTWNGVGAPTPPVDSVGLRAFDIHFPSVEERSEAISRLASLGVEVHRELDGNMTTVDPSGNTIILKA